jgi:enoyl-CoA hydratase/carnithine racemase
MTDRSLLTWREGNVMRVRMNRPANRNALNLATCEELLSVFSGLRASETDVGVVVLDAEGPCFCAGADLKERKGKPADWIRGRRLAAFDAYQALERCPIPVIALVHGPVIGSGAEIGMACDFMIAAEGAYFQFPETTWGTVGATQRLQRIVGKRRAKDLLFTGRTMSSSEALGLGLVARVVNDANLQAVGMETAKTIASAPALTMRLTKQAIDLGEEVPLDTGIRIELAAIDRNLAGGEWRAGLDRFSSARDEERGVQAMPKRNEGDSR